MNEIINFITTHYQLIIQGILLVVSVLFFILRKKPIYDIFSYLYPWCINAINFIEGTNVIGSKQKLEAALNVVEASFHELFPNVPFVLYEDIAKNMIERILDTPQKKG